MGIILSYDLFLDSHVTKYLVDGFIIVDESLYPIWLDLYYNISQKVKFEGYSLILDSWVWFHQGMIIWVSKYS
jgi:hypothetical protein